MKIGQGVIEQVISHARQDAPVEACGFLIGTEGRILRHYPVTNAERRNDHFTFEPNEQLAAYRTAGQEGLEVMGVYHSHPASPATPSAEDVRLARKSALLHIIVSLMNGGTIVKGFYIKEGEVEVEPLTVVED